MHNITISPSSGGTFLSCRKMYWWSHIVGIVPKKRKKVLDTGSLIHYVMESIYSMDFDLEKRIDKWIQETDAYNNYEASVVDGMIALAREIFPRYLDKYQSDFRDLKILAVEKRVNVPMEFRKKRQISYMLSTQFDVIARDKRDQLVIMDHKTTDDGKTESVQSKYDISQQKLSYAWTAVKAFAPKGFFADGVRCTGVVFVYNIIRRKIPPKPSVNKDGKLSIAFCDTLDSIYQSSMIETNSFEQRHQENLDRLIRTGDNFLYRFQYLLKQEVMERFLDDQADIVKDIRTCTRENRWPRNYTACHNFYNRRCSYADICLDPRADVEAIIKESFVKSDYNASIEVDNVPESE